MRMELRAQQALGLWSRALSGSVRDNGPDLTARQMAILLTVFMEPPPHTVRGLAARLNITKPVVTRALDTLSRQGFVRRRRDRRDKRSIFVQRTMAGVRYLNALADFIVDAGETV